MGNEDTKRTAEVGELVDAAGLLKEAAPVPIKRETSEVHRAPTVRHGRLTNRVECSACGAVGYDEPGMPLGHKPNCPATDGSKLTDHVDRCAWCLEPAVAVRSTKLICASHLRLLEAGKAAQAAVIVRSPGEEAQTQPYASSDVTDDELGEAAQKILQVGQKQLPALIASLTRDIRRMDKERAKWAAEVKAVLATANGANLPATPEAGPPLVAEKEISSAAKALTLELLTLARQAVAGAKVTLTVGAPTKNLGDFMSAAHLATKIALDADMIRDKSLARGTRP